jgi:RNA polymerase sigma-70 factor, ECF subfamily
VRAAIAVHETGESDTNAEQADFAALMTAEQKRVFLLCLRLLRDRDEADSATQDVFLEAYRTMTRPGSQEIREPGKWLTRVACYTCYDRLRSKRWMFWQRNHAVTSPS